MRLAANIALTLGLLTTSLIFADEGSTAPASKSTTDYQLQGEYRGTVTTGDGNMDFGAQVIALGDDNFRVVGFHGGLPGDGWMRGEEPTTFEAKLVDGKITSAVKEATIEVTANEISIVVDGNKIGALTKHERTSPTMGMKPPAGATVLFDGTSADQFENGKVIEEDGKTCLASTGCSSNKKFGDHSLHIEFRTPFMPAARGQGRGNSGVYVQSRYEVQVLDSFGLDGKDNECGGIYQVAEPVVNMCLPPLAWQTYDIDFTSARYDDAGKKTANARITVKHNGFVIHDNRELPHATPGRGQEAAGPGALFLQDHGNPVLFRNIWVMEK